MTSQALLFTLSALGISETVYLIKKRLLSQEPVCPVGDNCLAVLGSKYNKTLFIPNDALGLLFYVASAIITAFLVIEIPPLTFWNTAMQIFIIAGSLLSVYFTYLQFRIIKAWYFWCLMSACTIWLMAVIIIVSKIY